MIIASIIIGLAFIWLGYETNWVRVRLLVGIETSTKYKTWAELKPWSTKKSDPMWLRFPKIMEPLSGWDWLENTMHIIPEYTIELITDTSKITMRSQNMSILRDAFKVYRNPWAKVKLQ